MTIAYAVIGANYGDEGKGLMVDYLARTKANPIDVTVVRFNGGAQAGHTVQLPSGRRQVFHHLGSGTLAGASTMLSQFFISNPAVFRTELEASLIKPQIRVHGASPVTTPLEMLINQAKENYRGKDRHGSCGLGIFATVEREQWTSFNVHDLYTLTRNELKHKLRWLKKEYANLDLGYTLVMDKFDDAMMEKWLDDAEFFVSNTSIYDSVRVFDEDTIIFEGAQGLALDQHNRADFPHLTPSNTGMENVSILARQMGIDMVRAVYVSRTYLTRHGNGPLPFEAPMPAECVDLTNVPNPFQGTLRYAPLDAHAVRQRALNDIIKATLPIEPAFALTCADQVPLEPGLKPRYISYGPTHSHVREV